MALWGIPQTIAMESILGGAGHPRRMEASVEAQVDSESCPGGIGDGTRHVARRLGLALVGVLTALLLTSPLAARAEFVDPTLWTAGPVVRALATDGSTLYVGGSLRYVGPNTGALAGVSATTGARVGYWPRVDGTICTVAADGAGGWYLGGLFHRVAGVVRNNIAHIRADGTLDGWAPDANSTVGGIVVSGSTLYVCGDFTSIGGQTRVHLAALDAETGLATAWNPGSVGSVATLAVDGSTVYVGGSFTSVGGAARSCIAALDAATGLATAWNPDGNYGVRAIVVDGPTIYVGGDFTHIGGQARYCLAAVDATSGLASPWAPTDYGTLVFAIAVSDSTVYVGHQAVTSFSSGRKEIRSITALDAITGQRLEWHSEVDSLCAMTGCPYDIVRSIVVQGAAVYVGGEFGDIGRGQRFCIAALDVTTGLATAWNPIANGAVLAIAVADDVVVAGGAFSSIGGRPATSLAAFDLSTGEGMDWSPAPPGAEFITLAVAGSTLYAGCGVDAGLPALPQPLGAIDLPSGSILPWDPGGDGSIHALAAADSVVFAGGYFSTMGGGSHPYLVALDRATGISRDPCPAASGTVKTLAWSGPTLLVGGTFTALDGQTRQQIGAFDASSGVVNGWDPAADGEVTTLTVSGSTVYAGGRFGTIGGKARARVAALDAATGSATDWNPAADGAVGAIAVIGSTAYVGGSFTTIGGQARRGFAALDAATGAASDWDPSLPLNQSVSALATSGEAIYAGGGFNSMGGRVVGQLARVLPSPASPPVVCALGPEPGEVVRGSTVHALTWTATAPQPGVESVDLYLSTTGSGGPWHLIGAGAVNTGTYAWNVDPAMASADCYLRVDARDYAGNLGSDVGDAAFTITDGALDSGAEPDVVTLGIDRVVPHPVRGPARLEYSLPRPYAVRISLLDVQGRELRVLWTGPRGAGRHSVRLDPRGLPPGLYFARLGVEGSVVSRRFVVVE